MVFKHHVSVITLLIFLAIISCSSQVRGARRITGEAVMYGMVYNEENMPVSNAEVFIDGKSTTFTDTQGRFILISRQRNEFTLSVERTGYETVSGIFRFEPMDVIHLVMVNAIQLINRAEIAMAEGRFHDVIALCNRALALNAERIDASFLKALSLIRLREYDLARIILEELQERIGQRDYISRVLEDLP